jgi:triacylglycerol lipase
MIRFRTNPKATAAKPVAAPPSPVPPDPVRRAPDSPFAVAQALQVGAKVLLFGALRTGGAPKQRPGARLWRRQPSTVEVQVPATLRARLTPRGRWHPIDVQPDGTWRTLVGLSARQLAREGHSIQLQLEAPHGTVEREVPLCHLPTSCRRIVVCDLDVIRAEAAINRDAPAHAAMAQLLRALTLNSSQDPDTPRPSGALLYWSQRFATFDEDRLLVRRLKLPKGLTVPADLVLRERSRVGAPSALLREFNEWLPSQVGIVWLGTTDSAADWLEAATSTGPPGALEAVLLWPGARRRARKPSPPRKSTSGNAPSLRVLFVENAVHAGHLLAERGWLVSGRGDREQPIRRRRNPRRTTRYPLVLCHGLLGYSTLAFERNSLADYFYGVRRYLEDHGLTVWTPEVAGTHGICDRAEQLRETIGRLTTGPVNLIGHSMGGLDARWLISRLDMADRVPVLVTLATPHYGTSFANWFLERAVRRVPVLPVLEALGHDMKGYRDVTPEACRRFNHLAPDAPGVTYYAYTASVSRQRVSPVLRQSYDVLWREEGPNDGMVSVASATRGAVLGHLGTDHFCQIGHGHFQSDFDHRAFFLSLARELARRGF